MMTDIDIPAIVAEIQESLEQAADPERAEWAKGNYPTAMRVIGVKVPDLRPVVKSLSKRLRKVPAEEVIEISKALVDSGVLECQQVAYELISRHAAATAALRLEDVKALAALGG
jgi:hypothetical protein